MALPIQIAATCCSAGAAVLSGYVAWQNTQTMRATNQKFSDTMQATIRPQLLYDGHMLTEETKLWISNVGTGPALISDVLRSGVSLKVTDNVIPRSEALQRLCSGGIGGYDGIAAGNFAIGAGKDVPIFRCLRPKSYPPPLDTLEPDPWHVELKKELQTSLEIRYTDSLNSRFSYSAELRW